MYLVSANKPLLLSLCSQIFEMYSLCTNCPIRTSVVCTIIQSRIFKASESSDCHQDKYQRRRDLQGRSIRLVGVDVNLEIANLFHSVKHINVNINNEKLEKTIFHRFCLLCRILAHQPLPLKLKYVEGSLELCLKLFKRNLI
jgi:hypothetical protein